MLQGANRRELNTPVLSFPPHQPHRKKPCNWKKYAATIVCVIALLFFVFLVVVRPRPKPPTKGSNTTFDLNDIPSDAREQVRAFSVIGALCVFIFVALFSAPACWALCRSVSLTRAMRKFFTDSQTPAIRSDAQEMGLSLSFAFISLHVATTKSRLPNMCADKGKMKQIMHEACGYFRPRTLTAIMGPSGSGKTTLMNLLCSQTRTGDFEGARLINGQAYSLDDYRHVIRKQGYVRQEDCFFEDLTVRQTLRYQALLVCKNELPLASKLAWVEEVLREVGLEKVADTKIGGTSSSGLSGGQKRRLSIALEIIRLPGIIFLDEPTSGLDSTSSLQLVSLLSRLAHQGRTIVASVHQPRAEIFALFDNILLMGVGGHVLYLGPAASAAAYLSRCPLINVKLEDYDNHGDFIIDAIGLDPEKENVASVTRTEGAEEAEAGSEIELRNFEGPSSPSSSSPRSEGQESSVAVSDGEEEKKIVAYIPVSRGKTHPLADYFHQSSEYTAVLHEIAEDVRKFRSGEIKGPEADPDAYTIPYAAQVRLLFARRLQRANSSVSTTVAFYAQLCLVALVVGDAFSYPAESESVEVSNDIYRSIMVLLFMCSYACILQYLVLVPEYFNERPILKKERSSSSYSLSAYITSCLLAEFPRAMMQSLILWAITYSLIGLNKDAVYFSFGLGLLIMCVGAWQSLICLVSVLTDDMGTVYSVLFLVLGLGTLYGGMAITYDNIPAYFTWAYYFSIPAMGTRALISNDLFCCKYTGDCDDFRALFAAKLQTPVLAGNITQSCPKALQSKSPGNLGQVALNLFGLGDINKFAILLAFAILLLLLRPLSVARLAVREKQQFSVHEIAPERTAQRVAELK